MFPQCIAFHPRRDSVRDASDASDASCASGTHWILVSGADLEQMAVLKPLCGVAYRAKALAAYRCQGFDGLPATLVVSRTLLGIPKQKANNFMRAEQEVIGASCMR